MRKAVFALILGSLIGLGIISSSHSTEKPKKQLAISKPIIFYKTKPRQVSNKDYLCLVKNIYHEARGQAELNMIGVAQVTLNRVDTGFNGKKSICKVVFDRKQFSWTSKNQYKKRDSLDWDRAKGIAEEVLNGLRIVGLEDAIYFHSTTIKRPKWSKKLVVAKTIETHLFLKDTL